MSTTRTSGGSGPEDDGPEQELFARAVDGELRGLSDSQLDRELAVVASLRRVGTVVRPDSLERARMRRRVMAEFPTVVGGSSPVLPLRPQGPLRAARPSRGSHRRRRAGFRPWHGSHEPHGRFAVAAAAALCLIMSLSGMSLLLSRDAIPGDALYAFKRTAESAELGLTFGDERKALKHLEFAQSRIGEIEALAHQADAAGDWMAGEHSFLRALDDFEADTTAGTRLLTRVAAEGQTDVLAPVGGWVQQQQERLRGVRGALPMTSSSRLYSTLELLDRVSTRVDGLQRRAGCDNITSGAEDDLGPLPARDACITSPRSGPSAAAPLGAGEDAADALGADSLLVPELLAAVQDGGSGDEAVDPRGTLQLPAPGSGDVLSTPGGDPGGSGSVGTDGGDRTGPLRQLLQPEQSSSEDDRDYSGIPLLPLLRPDDTRVE